MTENSFEIEDPQDTDQDGSQDPDWLKKTRQQARKAAAFEKEAADARRELALLKAGVER